MKRFLILLFLVPFALSAQNLKDKINTDIRGKIYDPAKAANMHQAIVDGMIAVTASGTNAYTATVNAAITSYQTGYQQLVKFTNANTTASTINFNALGVKSLVKDGAGTALASGDLKANTTYLLSYDGTNFQVLNIPGSGGGGGISGLTSGRVTFATSGTTIGDDSNLVWDNTNKRLNIGVPNIVVPRTNLQIRGQSTGTGTDRTIYIEDSGGNGVFSLYDNGRISINSTTINASINPISSTGVSSVIQSLDTGFGGAAFGSVTNHPTGFLVNNSIIARFDTSGSFGIATTPQSSSILDIVSTTKALKLPLATRASIVTPTNGHLTVDTNVPYFHNGTSWDVILRSSAPTITGTNITTTDATFDVFNTTATTINAFGAATTVNIGAATGTLTLRNPTITGTNATALNMNGASPSIVTSSTGTASVFNTNALTGNIFGAATTVTIGAATGTLNLRNVTLTAANATSFAMNGASPSITTTSTGTASVFNTAALTGNLFGAATTLSVGGTPTGAVTHNYSANATATATTKTVNLGTAGAAGSTTNVNIGSATASAVLGTLTLGFPTIVQPSNYTSLALFNTQSTTVNFAGAATTFNLGGTPTTTVTGTLFGNATATGNQKTINIGSQGVSGSITNINIGTNSGGNTFVTSQLAAGNFTINNTNDQVIISTGLFVINKVTTSSAATFVFQGATGISGATTGQSVSLVGGNGFGTGSTNPGDVNLFSGTPFGAGTEGAVNIQTRSGARVGVFGASAVAQQSVNTILVNNVTSGGTLSTIANYTDLTTYSNDAAAIRNNFFRLTEKVLQLETALRNYGWVKN